MCGICGWIGEGRDGRDAESALTRMNASLAHRGPDDSGMALFPGAALAMTRLSVIDLHTGHQPMVNEAESVWIVYNGEVYNYRALREELEAKGYRFRTESDTEVLLRAYEAWGQDCVLRLRGMFAFAILDRRGGAASRPVLFLARDRVGKKPLYYHHAPGLFVFGSEIKALLAHPDVPRRVNRAALPLYLTYGYVPAPQTFFDLIAELPPGHTLLVRDGQFSLREYWDVSYPPQSAPPLAEEEVIPRLRALLEEAVRIRLVSDVPLGSFLSGGVDSTAIVALMAKQGGARVKTFAIGFEGEPSFNELEYSRQAARFYGTEHHEFVVQPDAIELLPKLIWHYDQPFADSSAMPTFLVSRLARQHVTVALTGDGGDELFAGYDRFAAARLAMMYQRLPPVLQAALPWLLRRFSESTAYDGFVRRARRFVEHAPLPVVEQYLAWVSVFQKTFLEELVADMRQADIARHVGGFFDRVKYADPVSQLLYVNTKTYLPGDLLVKTDRMTMANSLETRCPFLDHELLEFAAGIPSNLKLKGLTTKYILKKALEGIVPTEILRRKKHGFGMPVGRWFRTKLREYLRTTLLDSQALRRGYFREAALRRLIDEHQSGQRDHGHRLWALLTFELWHRTFIDGRPV